MKKLIPLLIIPVLLFACKTDTPTPVSEQKPPAEPVPVVVDEALGGFSKPPRASSNETENIYPWKTDYDINTAIVNRIGLPGGYERIPADKGSFADWLRHLPLLPEGSPVKYHNGGIKGNQVHHSVIDLDTGKRDLQQCADAVMRLKAEYHYSNKEYDKIAFNFTSGDRVAFSDWSKGKKPVISGNSVRFSSPSGSTDTGYSNFKKYMIQIFTYAGTASLSKEMKRVNVNDIRIGDVFIQGGFPGHAVLVMDIAENKEGKKLFMLAQSYMPAQDMHILKNPNNRSLSPWYDLDFGSDLQTPEWGFTSGDLKRFR